MLFAIDLDDLEYYLPVVNGLFMKESEQNNDDLRCIHTRTVYFLVKAEQQIILIAHNHNLKLHSASYCILYIIEQISVCIDLHYLRMQWKCCC